MINRAYKIRRCTFGMKSFTKEEDKALAGCYKRLERCRGGSLVYFKRIDNNHITDIETPFLHLLLSRRKYQLKKIKQNKIITYLTTIFVYHALVGSHRRNVFKVEMKSTKCRHTYG